MFLTYLYTQDRPYGLGAVRTGKRKKLRLIFKMTFKYRKYMHVDYRLKMGMCNLQNIKKLY